MSNKMVSQHRAVFSEPPQKTPSDTAVDGPLMGNGDMGVAMTSHGKDHHFILCKNDLWRLEHQYQKSCPVPLGQLSLTLYGYAKAEYRVTQDLATATTTTLLEKANGSVTMPSYVAASWNLLVIQIAATGAPVHARASLNISSGRGSEAATGSADGIFWGTRAFTKGVDLPTGAAAALALCGGDDLGSDGSFVVRPEQPVTLVLAMESSFKAPDFKERAVEAVKDLSDQTDLTDLRAAHEARRRRPWRANGLL